ncbi:protein of unknown function [Azorhizobium caulinodans ORS 571]|uniref:DUF1275 domain-containing protein n=1 Tax=Azorhizobium caulinodans (strain ATCC 43989 / DSM 5975 / JCM 20966 / LMG 6465 / NBRC 14845 / NCIMB 13405 / ORS 571) TaxID=438753 RepID=A8HSA3_AZOC5|nr:YoaK family protein [Azorhizobium caulinodans]BAF90157.1 protein of unknown function [Azorhizobium caulinodans ORS 571]
MATQAESGAGAAEKSRSACRHPLLFAVVMTAVAGYVDAVGFSQADKLYLSFMSGNSTRLGSALAQGDFSVLLLAGLVVLCFVGGAALGTLIMETVSRHRMVWVLVAEILLFATALALVLTGWGRLPLFLIAATMGMQNTAHQVVDGADIGKSFVTGTLFSFGQSLVRALLGRASARECADYALSWVAFICGVALGAVVVSGFGLVEAIAAVLAVLTLTAAGLRAGWL